MPKRFAPGAIPHPVGCPLRLLVLCAGFLLTVAAPATTVRPPEFGELVNESDYVIRARVTAVTSEFRPATKGRRIVTLVDVEVLEVISGEPPAQVRLQMLGGRVGDEEIVVQGAPRFQVGDEDILFVSGNGRTIYPLYAMMHGRYPVLTEPKTGRAFVARSNRVPLQAVDDVALPMADGPAAEMQRRMVDPARALTPAQFASQIRELRSPGHRRARLE